MYRDLTPEEKAKPYAKYFYAPPAPPDPGLLENMKAPIDAAKALPIERINDLLNPGYMEVETGYCVMPDGSAYVAAHTKMPGVTVDMIHWWFAWHSLEDLRYKIWWPKGHYAISISEEARQKVLNPNLPLTQKFQGITHHVVEDVGAGPEDIYISFLSPEEMGFDMGRFVAPNVATVIGANGLSAPVGSPPDAPKAPAVMCHFVREIPGGVEFRTRFWLGYHIIDRRPRLLLPPGVKLPEMIPKGLGVHCLLEYANLRAILPKLYEEQRGVIG